MARVEVPFGSHGGVCRAWRYAPAHTDGTGDACERLGRKCRAVEISPAYCAVAIQRWVDMTGGEPVILDDSR